MKSRPRFFKQTLVDHITQPRGLHYLRTFLESEFCEENLDFYIEVRRTATPHTTTSTFCFSKVVWIQVQKLVDLGVKDLEKACRAIYDRFIGPTAQKQVNLEAGDVRFASFLVSAASSVIRVIIV